MRQARSAQFAQPSFLQWIGGSLFLIAFGGVFFYFLYPPVLEYIDSAHWIERKCTILSAELVEGDTPNTTGSETQAVYGDRYRYSYTVDGARYVSSRYTFLNPLTSNAETHHQRLSQYRPGTVVTCYVDPENPSAAVISRDFSLFNLLIVLPSVFILLGAVGLLTTLKRAVIG